MRHRPQDARIAERTAGMGRVGQFLQSYLCKVSFVKIRWRATGTMAAAMAPDEIQIPLSEQLEEIGAQLDWVRGYL
jgi:hypothetical protein